MKLTVSVTLFFSVIVLAIAVIFFIFIINNKPTERHTYEIKEIGWELVNQLKKETEQYYEKIQTEREKIEVKVEELKKIKEVVEPLLNEAIKTNKQQDLIKYMNNRGFSVDEISKILKVKKGEVEVSINMNKQFM